MGARFEEPEFCLLKIISNNITDYTLLATFGLNSLIRYSLHKWIPR